VWSIAAFTILVTGVSVTASLLVLVAGVFVWVGLSTSCAGRRGLTGGSPDGSATNACGRPYRRPAARGFLPLLKTVSADA
jgi:hypothetical protein